MPPWLKATQGLSTPLQRLMDKAASFQKLVGKAAMYRSPLSSLDIALLSSAIRQAESPGMPRSLRC
ncbi:hypothetical protein Psi02_54730 [Planotetraspora silvatica]|uniref:Uncharacterized protein n=1 Tax=Planotetraspora silvatica TaxID=234614 RepID=A0A8J3UV91_9ACTN|nr:hypothetical protein Psi02_54730 [Planotetraspora silvatica]